MIDIIVELVVAFFLFPFHHTCHYKLLNTYSTVDVQNHKSVLQNQIPHNPSCPFCAYLQCQLFKLNIYYSIQLAKLYLVDHIHYQNLALNIFVRRSTPLKLF